MEDVNPPMAEGYVPVFFYGNYNRVVGTMRVDEPLRTLLLKRQVFELSAAYMDSNNGKALMNLDVHPIETETVEEKGVEEWEKIMTEDVNKDLIVEFAGKDVPTITNARGGSQSHVPVRFDLIDGPALFAMAKVLYEGAEKYGANNWRKIDVEDHLNHLIMHAYAYLSGDRSDEHLSHIMCRAMFAQAVDMQSDDY